jgi:glycosyltransferase involved in cell wall biosynthesis
VRTMERPATRRSPRMAPADGGQEARVGPPALRIGMVSANQFSSDPRVRRQAEALAAHGYAVDVICQRWPGDPAVEQLCGVTVRRVGSSKYRGDNPARYALAFGRFFGHALIALTRLHRRYGYAAVQVYSMPEALVLTALWPRLTGVPLIYAAGDLTTELYATKFGAGRWPLAAGVLWLQERLGLWLADLVITVHEDYRRRLLARGVPAHRLRVVMNLPDERLFHSAPRNRRPAAAPRHSPAPGGAAPLPEPFTLVHHGSLVERYGADLAVEAVARLRERIPGLRLRIYGDGDLRSRLVQRIADLGLADRVYLSPGYIPLDELPPLLADADVGLVPNRADAFTDTILPTKLLEYLALGLPTVVTRTRTVLAHVPPDVVEYCAPDDVDDLARAIERVWADAARRQALQEAARAYSATHRWADAAAAYCGSIDALVGRRNQP